MQELTITLKGGWSDYVGAVDDITKAIDLVKKKQRRPWHDDDHYERDWIIIRDIQEPDPYKHYRLLYTEDNQRKPDKFYIDNYRVMGEDTAAGSEDY